MYTATVYLHQEVEKELKRLRKRNLIKSPFLIWGVKEYETRLGFRAFQLKIAREDGSKFVGGFRQRIETQLLEAGLLKLEQTPAQEKALKKLVRWFELDEKLFQSDCFVFSLLGYLDQAEEERLISHGEYLSLREIIKSLRNPFQEDFAWFFGEDCPEDCHRGLE